MIALLISATALSSTYQKRFLREIVLVELVELLGGYIPRRNRGDIDAKGA